ncbi:hypothetical protein PMN64_41490 [Bradyrhizobium sp. UFLA01-814]|uniref:hypothetical protein n=1 Tax=Bradyrhizobium sp. UFLA01-814 TaxID=3023480 RepID=UPI00398BAC9E
MAVPVMAIVGGREMRDVRVSLREHDDLQADVPLAEAVSRLQARARPAPLRPKHATVGASVGVAQVSVSSICAMSTMSNLS